MTLKDARRALDRALKRLAPEQGRLARRNARAAIASATRALRAAVDAEFPALRLPRVPGKRRGRKRDPLRGYASVLDAKVAPYAAAGLPVRKDEDDCWNVPAWAVPFEQGNYGPHWDPLVPRSEGEVVAALRRARKGEAERRRMRAERAVVGACPDAASRPLRRAALARLRTDGEFCRALLVAAAIDCETTRGFIESQHDTTERFLAPATNPAEGWTNEI
jgi:hypothetical protein